MHRVFVTGASGFVGHAVLQRLSAAGHVVRCLCRLGSEARLRGLEAVDRVTGDILAVEGLPDAMSGCDTLVHLVGIIRERPGRQETFGRVHVDGTQNVLDAARAVGIKRVLHMSALGARAGAPARYHQTKWAAEELVRASGLDWTIFRPSVIYGPGDELVTRLAAFVRRLPVVPVVGSGRARLQPIAVGDVAEAFGRALDRVGTIRRTYDVGGPDALSFNEFLDLIGRTLGRERVRKLHLPVGLVRALARGLGPLGFPVTTDQTLMLGEDNVCDPAPFVADYTLQPLGLAAGLDAMLNA